VGLPPERLKLLMRPNLTGPSPTQGAALDLPPRNYEPVGEHRAKLDLGSARPTLPRARSVSCPILNQ
jgi:hypothetical protein